MRSLIKLPSLQLLVQMLQMLLGPALGDIMLSAPNSGHGPSHPRSGLGATWRPPPSAPIGCSCCPPHQALREKELCPPSPLSSHKSGLGMKVSVSWCPHPVDLPVRTRRAWEYRDKFWCFLLPGQLKGVGGHSQVCPRTRVGEPPLESPCGATG